MFGVVKWFNEARGFGFITHTDGRDIFVHYSVIEMHGFRTLSPAARVEYELREGPRGLFATRVRVDGEAVAVAASESSAGRAGGEFGAPPSKACVRSAAVATNEAMADSDDPEPTLPLWYMQSLTWRGGWADRLDSDETTDGELVRLVAGRLLWVYERIDAAASKDDASASAGDLDDWRGQLADALVSVAVLKRRLEGPAAAPRVPVPAPAPALNR